MKILLIGHKGQLGWELEKQLPENGFVLESVDLPEFDITDQTAIERVMKDSAPDLVINACAYTAVDKAETDVETAFAVNQHGPAFLARACHDTTPLIHISTDYVFDGFKKGAYTEDDPISPLGIYGKSKAFGEKAVMDNHKRHVIIRTAWLCGVHGQNFVKTMLRLGRERESLKVVNDQYGSPTFAFDLAGAIVEIAKKYAHNKNLLWGIYHYTGHGRTSWFHFVEKIFELARPMTPLKVKHVIPISTESYPTPAKRPVNSELSCRKIREMFGIQNRPWEESLHEMLRIMLK